MLLTDGVKVTIPHRQYGWKNLYLTTAGTIVVPGTYDTERAARDDADRFFAEWQEYVELGGEEPVDLPDGVTLPFSAFRCALQVPVTD